MMPHRRVGTKSEPSQFISEYEHISLVVTSKLRFSSNILNYLSSYSLLMNPIPSSAMCSDFTSTVSLKISLVSLELLTASLDSKSKG
jgi:hypothetical protein